MGYRGEMHKTHTFSWVNEDGTSRRHRSYYFTEGAFKQDAAALKKGEVYIRDDFFNRARAWYKTEIDRRISAGELVREDPVAHQAIVARMREHSNPCILREMPRYNSRPPQRQPNLPLSHPRTN